VTSERFGLTIGSASLRIAIMQATLMIDDDLLDEARRVAAARSVSVDAVVVESLRSFLHPKPATSAHFIVPTFEVPDGTPPITPDDQRRAEEEL
jgi:hypothetical protein